MMSKTKTFILLLLAAAVISTMVAYNIWERGKLPEVPEQPEAERGTIGAIVYNEENPTALINNKVVHEGDSIQGVKVVKIHRNEIEFDKNGKRWTQRLHAKPDPAW